MCSRCRPQQVRRPIDLFVNEDGSFPGVTTVCETLAAPGQLETYTAEEMAEIQRWVENVFK